MIPIYGDRLKPTTFGRFTTPAECSTACSIHIASKYISRVHAQLFYFNSSYFLRIVGTNGVKINNVLYLPHSVVQLQKLDVLDFVGTQYLFKLELPANCTDSYLRLSNTSSLLDVKSRKNKVEMGSSFAKTGYLMDGARVDSVTVDGTRTGSFTVDGTRTDSFTIDGTRTDSFTIDSSRTDSFIANSTITKTKRKQTGDNTSRCRPSTKIRYTNTSTASTLNISSSLTAVASSDIDIITASPLHNRKKQCSISAPNMDGAYITSTPQSKKMKQMMLLNLPPSSPPQTDFEDEHDNSILKPSNNFIHNTNSKQVDYSSNTNKQVKYSSNTNKQAEYSSNTNKQAEYSSNSIHHTTNPTFDSTPCFVKLARSKLDAHNNKVEDFYYYNPEFDSDPLRKLTFSHSIRPSRRCTLIDPQYYYKPIKS
ncbi:hypothetical protein BB561_005655 [Smittium simulii]|uniref:FHA domain-containing protein n=1 Tax=Smittium simulii TaxID=133385 RepID=A0A2T9Y9B4_9FUNG|nr:hypothetical protein BB561_005655 [Smittium simulii]